MGMTSLPKDRRYFPARPDVSRWQRLAAHGSEVDLPHMTDLRTTLSLRAGTPGVVSAQRTTVGGRDVILAVCDPTEHKGALNSADGETLAAAATHALDAQLPFVVEVASAGADVLQGLAASVGWGLAARAISRCSGVVPLLASVTGPAVSGPALLLGLADHVVATADAYAFVSGPRMVHDFTGIRVDNTELGGAGVHATETGLASLVVAAGDRTGALDAVGDLLAYLPDHVDALPPTIPTFDPVDRPCPELRDLIPASSTGSYDVRHVIAALADDGELLEVRAGWASNLVTAMCSIGGQPIGVVANQPQSIAGTLDIPASQKGARFVAWCDAFNIPLLTLIDTPGFYPGKDLEWRGMIRHGAQLAFAYARATVPRVAVVLRKAYGGAYIVMDSRYMGNDLYLSWPEGEIAVMGAKGAVEILHRRSTPEERAAAEADYEARLLAPWPAAERGSVDAVIDPADTRKEVAAAFEMLKTKQEKQVKRKHDNMPC
jgi:acetyl-CoA carboxylase carboxyltransferase component